MVKFVIAAVLCYLVIAIPLMHAAVNDLSRVEHWFNKLKDSTQKVTKIHFYFHEKLYGYAPNAASRTAVTAAQANFTFTLPSLFGMINVMDDPITVGPEWDSKPLGYAKGFYAAASIKEISLAVCINFVFTDGEFNGSTISIVGHDPPVDQYREMPIIGGSGKFRLARGVATFHNVNFDVPASNATIEVTLFALHY